MSGCGEKSIQLTDTHTYTTHARKCAGVLSALLLKPLFEIEDASVDWYTSWGVSNADLKISQEEVRSQSEAVQKPPLNRGHDGIKSLATQ